MGDLEKDLALEGGDGSYTLALSRDWNIWGPNGGYMAAVAQRAIGAHSEFNRPVSLACHFLGVAQFEPVDIVTTTLKKTKRAEAVRATVTQNGKPMVEAISWVIGEVGGLEHVAVKPPDIPHHSECKTIQEHLAEEGIEDEPPFKFWNNFDVKPTFWLTRDQWENRPAREPVFQEWFRFQPRSTFDDPFLDAARLLIALDVVMWPAATNAYDRPSLTHIAPSMDLYAMYHELKPKAEWLLVDGFSPRAGDGLVGGQARVWDEEGNLLGSAAQQMLCRPAPQMAP